ncbi:isoform 3 of zinc finger protein 740 [Aspergillus udagawae]|nr:isoform 3 of zinc finger protein 740 [Aspergillus udagawae]
MVLKKCNICDRRFKKTEHFKRHERSHTKEKPYECNVCHKRFSRSDVLSRHAKGHNAASSSTTTGVVKSDQHQTSSTQAYDQQHSRVNGNGQFIPSINPVGAQQTQILPFIPREISLTTPDGLPSSSLDCLTDISAHQARTHPQLNPMVMGHQQAYLGWGDVTAAEPSPYRVPVFGPVPNDILQFWLEPRGDTASNPSPIDLMRDASVSLVDDQTPASPRAQQNGHPVENPSIQSPSNIPSERFARVQRYWVTPTNNTGRLMNTLWRDVASSSLDNILGVYSGQPFNSPSGLSGDLRYGLDEECRQNLLATFGQARLSTPNDASTAPRMSEAPFGSPQAFPPAEILDMALDLYFRNFQPLIPFIHIPTFSAKRTRSPVLYVMCMIGMIILGTKGTTSFVSKNFNLVLDKITGELAKCAAGSETSVGTVSTFAAAFLFLNLAAMTGEKEHIAKSQMLYINLMTIAQRHGLFAATEGQILDMSLYEAIPDVDARWKAWSKVESVKRLIIGLLLLDSSYSSFLSTSPIIVPEAIQFILPCEGAIFDAKNAMHWMQLIRIGKRILMPTVVAPSENVDLPTLDSSVDSLCMHGVLAMVQLRLCEAYHRLLSNRANYPFAPCHTYAMDGRARCLPTLQLQIADKYREALERLNPNAVVMWHNMCMTLTADIQIFELAAGRSGPLPARKALEDIAVWSQTPAARRACLHAAQIYKAMVNRKASDYTMFHSVLAVFTAALVLGLYTFMAPRPPETTAGCISVELLDDVDWQQVGREGFTSFMEPRGNHAFTASDNSTVNFIRNGGTLYLRGIPVQGGYQSARRILLDYAGLLKDSGKWSVRKFSHVLHIMSDVLMDME